MEGQNALTGYASTTYTISNISSMCQEDLCPPSYPSLFFVLFSPPSFVSALGTPQLPLLVQLSGPLFLFSFFLYSGPNYF